MLDIDLIHEKPSLTTEFRVSLAADIFAAMSLVLDAPSIEGLDQWVYTTHGTLSDAMRADLAVVLILGTKSMTFHRWLIEHSKTSPVHRDFAAYVAWLNGFTHDDYRLLLDEFYAMLGEHCEEAAVAREMAEAEQAPLSETDLVRRCYGEMLDEAQIERLVQLYHSPLEFKAQLISVMTRFWEQFYRAEWERCLPLLERSMVYHRDQAYTGDLSTTFVAVTGRRFPKGHEEFADADHVIFVPSCHIGPYVMLSPCDDANRTLLIHYNARPTSTPEVEEIPSIQDLFPPLKALADETRLQILGILDGHELYAQEIVDQLDISQSAVSRHLALMVTGGLLDVRREESMKYYAINEGVLAALAEGLKRFRAPKK